MKTKRIYTALSLALIFATTLISTSLSAGKTPTGTNPNACIRYQVNVTIDNEKQLCNTYLIELRNERGALVAPAKPYLSGTTQYSFYERGPVEGIRIARLVRMESGGHFICEYELFTKPSVLKGEFENGQTYRFDLLPSLLPPRE